MALMRTYMLIAFVCSSVAEPAYSGRGKIYFPGFSNVSKSGFRVVYRPENYTMYSEMGERRTAYLNLIISVSEANTKRNYREDVLFNRTSSWDNMQWDSRGNYYYYEQNSSVIEPGFWFGYGVNIYNSDSKLVYEDINHFGQVSSAMENCELDEKASVSDIKCSEVLENSLDIHRWDYEAIGVAGTGEQVYSGTGKTYFTYYNQSSERGARVIYKPANYLKYSPLGEGRTAMLGFSDHITETLAKENYDQRVLSKKGKWAILEWENNGNYYYHDQTSGSVDPGDWVGYGVAIYNAESESIYEDIYHFYVVPSTVEYCELDNESLHSSKKCSKALDGPLNIRYWNVETTETPANLKAEYNGTGKIYFTNRYINTNIGIRIVYRPENYLKYSLLGNAAKSEIGFFGYAASESDIRENYVQEVLSKRQEWATLQWESEGKYYYLEQDDGNLSPGKWIGYGVTIHSADGRLIYEDTHHFYQLPTSIAYCELDSQASTSENKCSEALEGRLQKNDQTGDGTDDTNTTPVKRHFWIIGLVFGVLVITAVVVACVKKGFCRRGSQPPAYTTTTSVPLYVSGNQGFASSVPQISAFNEANVPPKYQPAGASQHQVDVKLEKERGEVNVPGYIDTRY